MTCVYSAEDVARPGGRAVMRGMARSDYQGHLAQAHSFVWNGESTLTIDGVAATVIDHGGAKVAAKLATALPRSELPSTFSANEQEAWQQFQDIAGAMNQTAGETDGSNDRVIILDFAQATATIATLLGAQLSEAQAVGCM